MENNSMDGSLASFGFQNLALATKNATIAAEKPFNFVPVDLATARSIAAGTALNIPEACGDTIFVEYDPYYAGAAINTVRATLYIGTDVGYEACGITITPGMVIKVPFKGLLLENVALISRGFKLFYGYGFDISTVVQNVGVSAGSNASGIAVRQVGQLILNGVSFNSTVNLGAGGVENVFSNVANMSGAVIYRGVLDSNVAAGASYSSIVAKNGAVAPGAAFDGDVILAVVQGTGGLGVAAGAASPVSMAINQSISAAHRLDRYSGAAETLARFSVRYTLMQP